MGILKKSAAAVPAVLLAAATAAPIASAGFDGDGQWNDEVNLSVGGVNTGDVVGIAQVMLQDESCYNWPNQIDGGYGTNTGWGTLCFQSKFGLTTDAIVGSATWNVMRLRIQYLSSAGGHHFYGHVVFAGTTGSFYKEIPGTTWKWRHGCASINGVSYDWISTDYPSKSFVTTC